MSVVSAAAATVGVQGALWYPWMHRLALFNTVTTTVLALWYWHMVLQQQR